MNEQEAMQIIAKSGAWENRNGVTLLYPNSSDYVYINNLKSALRTLGIEAEDNGNGLVRSFDRDAFQKIKNIQNSYHQPVKETPPPANSQQPSNTHQPVASSEDNGFNGGRYKDGSKYDQAQQDSHFTRTIDGIDEKQAQTAIKKAMNNANASTQKFKDSGSTGSIAIITKDNKLVVGQLGDSPVIVYIQDGNTGAITAHELTKDHSPKNRQEASRIERDGGFVGKGNRLNGDLAISRAFGDERHQGRGISHEPEIYSHDLNQYMKDPNAKVWVVVASDGITDNVKPAGYADVIKNNGTQQIPQAMVKKSKDYYNQIIPQGNDVRHNITSDNLTATVVEVKRGDTQSHIVGVFDGHGADGAAASRTVNNAVQNTLNHDGHIARTPVMNTANNQQNVSKDHGSGHKPKSLETQILEKNGQGRLWYVNNPIKGGGTVSCAAFTGDAQSLYDMQDALREKGVVSVLENNGASLRVKSDSMDKFNEITKPMTKTLAGQTIDLEMQRDKIRSNGTTIRLNYYDDASAGRVQTIMHQLQDAGLWAADINLGEGKFATEIQGGKEFNKLRNDYQSQAAELAEHGWSSGVLGKIGKFFGKVGAVGVLASPLAFTADFKEAQEKISEYVDGGAISQQAATEYAEMYAVAKLKQGAAMGIDPTVGYDEFRKWADKNGISSELLAKLDPTPVSAEKEKAGVPQRLPHEEVAMNSPKDQHQNNQQVAEANPNQHLPNNRGAVNRGVA